MKIIWPKTNQIPTTLKYPQYFYSPNSYYSNSVYWYGTVKRESELFHISVFSAVVTDKSPNVEARGRPLIHVELVKISDFETNLVFVDAEKMANKLANEGFIALYGIYFDFDSDALQAESDETLVEIGKALNIDPGLELFIVGHTDMEGSLQYNQDLSTRRAQSVVQALIIHYGVSSDRLIPIGIGPVAPVATNDSEAGRAQNRRVELVKR
jgi:outer membrane protein OmpA-like peptidoglycan-associated protein